MSSVLRLLAALLLGLVIGAAVAARDPALAEQLAGYAAPIGSSWLNALRMTIVPLVFGLIVTGIAAGHDAAKAGRLTRTALTTFAVLLVASSVLAALVLPLILSLFPLPAEAGAALRQALGHAEVPKELPGFAAFVQGIVPSNVLAAAVNDAFLPMCVFATVFAFATVRLPVEKTDRIVGLFSAIVDAMVTMIHWILALAPIGVFALALTVAGRSGSAAFTALGHYIVSVSSLGAIIVLTGYAIAWAGARWSLRSFAKAAIPAQAVAISTQSSLASLPAMLEGTDSLGVPREKSGVVLPLAVALFRSTGPAMNMGVAIYVAHLMGMQLGPWQLLAGVVAASLTTLGAVGLPGSITFFTSIAPICIAMGVPIEALALLVAVETLPDIWRTLGNVTMDMAVTGSVSRRA